MDFTGTSLALSSDALATVASNLGVTAPAIWAVLAVEAKGCGYLPDRRPLILFERHIFSRLTHGQYDATHPGISSPVQGGYGAWGAYQYSRLAEAMALNLDAGMQSASWGLAQTMGFNHGVAGFGDAEAMVSAMAASEDAQLEAFCAFLTGNKLAAPLSVHDWATFARGYNGKDYAINRYDVMLASHYAQFSNGALPDLTIRAAQIYLGFKGFDPHGVDGVLGPGTRAALSAFQASAGIPVTGQADDTTLQALMPA